MNGEIPALCGHDGCRRLHGHAGNHDLRPTEAWNFFSGADKNKITKAGFATPRGGAKGAYQNHVIRSSKVIVPFERMEDVDLALYRDGYVIRVLPEQYFAAPGIPKPAFIGSDVAVRIGTTAFVLYRTHDVLAQYPPMPDWQIRSLRRNGLPVERRGRDVEDIGHYVLRIPRLGERPKRFEGAPQGVFAPEYADEDTNFLSKCVLAWLMIFTQRSPYTLLQAEAGHLRAILRSEEIDNLDAYERSGTLRRGITSCPLCMRFLGYEELHETVSFDDENGLVNAAQQIEGATRSTVINLFHLKPLLYHELTHIPSNVGWGHAACNTRLGQRPCYSLQEIVEMNRKVGIVRDEGLVETFGWMSDDWLMIRSPDGAVWIKLNGDIEEGPPQEPEIFDAVVQKPQVTGDAESGE